MSALDPAREAELINSYLRDAVALVVDPSEPIRHFISSVLKYQCYCRKIMQSSSADDAIKLIDAGAPVDIVITELDFHPGGKTGIDLLTAIRGNTKIARTPVIMFTYRADHDSMLVAVEANVSDYLAKPAAATVLVQRIRRLIYPGERRHSLRVATDRLLSADLLLPGNREKAASVVNLSHRGVLLNVAGSWPEDVAVNDKLTVSLYPSIDADTAVLSGLLKTPGEVARLDCGVLGAGGGGTEVAIRFTNLDDKGVALVEYALAAIRDREFVAFYQMAEEKIRQSK